jgi:DNA repair exonuclease SbcCD ATPase subunit
MSLGNPLKLSHGGKTLMMTWTDLSDQYFHWWQAATTRYLELFKQEPVFLRGFGFTMERSLEFKKLMDQMMDEAWRNLRLPSLEEITRLQERLNLLESRLVALQERDLSQEVWASLEKRELATRKDLKPLEKALTDINKHLPDPGEMSQMREGLAQITANALNLPEELAGINEALAQLGAKLEALVTFVDKLAEVTATKKPAATVK